MARRLSVEAENLWRKLMYIRRDPGGRHDEHAIMTGSYSAQRFGGRLVGEETVSQVSNVLIAPVGVLLVGQCREAVFLPLPKLLDNVDPGEGIVFLRIVGAECRLTMVTDQTQLNSGLEDQFQDIQVIAGQILDLVDED